MKDKPCKNIDLHTLLRYQIIIAQNGRFYTINNRKNGDLTRVHAHSPQVIGAKLPHGTALYFVSCDFRGDDMKYSVNKFNAVKAYLDVLGVEYRVVLCNTLPRHNWKHILRTKDIDFTRYDEILATCQLDGKKAADQFYLEAEKAGPRSIRASEEDLEKFSYRITQNANQHRVELCQKIFSENKVILWSDHDQNLCELIDEYQAALKGCYKQCAEGARKREGNLIDNIVYKQEELVVGLHIANSMILQPVSGFYNEFTKQAEHTEHMIACQEFGHFELLDILYDEEPKITQALLDLGLIAKNEEKAKDPDKQLAQCVRLFPTIHAPLQKEFVLALLEQIEMQVPSQVGFINSCLKLYKTLPPSRQLPFLYALLEHPKKKIAAYYQFLETFDPVISDEYFYSRKGLLTYEIRQTCNKAHASFDPTELYSIYDEIKNLMQAAFSWRSRIWLGLSPVHITSEMSVRSSINLESNTQSNSSMLEIAIDAGADVQVKDNLERTPLYTAICKRNIMNIKTLLKAGAKINEKNEISELEYLKTLPQTHEIKEIVSVVENALAHQKSQCKK